MNGAERLLQTLVSAQVDVCFMNPGTSEMHFVAALDAVPAMRSVLTLFEGVASGAADGFARMTGRPAATLLHLGPGLSNALANVHNARRSHSPMLNVIGDHATYHQRYDAPLASDIAGLARPLSDWVRSSARSDDLARDALDAVRIARTPPGHISSLILPADVSWSAVRDEPAPKIPAWPQPERVDDAVIAHAASVLSRGEPCVLLMNNAALQERALLAAQRIAQKTGARLFCDTFAARWPRGAGRPVLARLGYFAEQAVTELQGTKHLLVCGTKAPVAFFAYPDKPSSLVPDGCETHTLAGAAYDCSDALERLAERLYASDLEPSVAKLQRPARPTGAITSQSVGAAIAAHMPDQAVVVDEGNTEGIFTFLQTTQAPKHDWLHNMGGSIGMGLPVAVGAAVACPDRKVICLKGDGSALYTIQALWTMARENLDVVTIIFANRSYRILNIELHRVGASAAGPRAKDMLDLTRPELDFVALAHSMGVPASRPSTAEELCAALERAMQHKGPQLIECRV
jgi:acetolactate synthase I/II/III large subunit